MGITSSTDHGTQNSVPESQNNEVPSEKLGDSSTVQRDQVDSESPKVDGDTEGEEEEEEEGECGFCLFMKGGGCKDSFVAWEDCVAEAEKNKEDIVTKCMEVTSMLKKCMDEHSDYYQPILAAEKAAEAEVKKEIEAEKNKEEQKEIEAEKNKEEQKEIEAEKNKEEQKKNSE